MVSDAERAELVLGFLADSCSDPVLSMVEEVNFAAETCFTDLILLVEFEDEID